MKRYIGLVFFIVVLSANSQPLRDINYNYLYNPDEKFTLKIKPVKQGDTWRILYSLQSRDSFPSTSDYTLQWEGREALSDKEGNVLSPQHSTEIKRTALALSGIITLPLAGAPKILAVKVVSSTLKQAWMFYTHLEPNYPVNNYIISNSNFIAEPYVNIQDNVVLGDNSGTWTVSYYQDDFPTAAPAFSEAQARVSKDMQHDSVFVVSEAPVNISRKGLYLIQRDTLSAEGLAFRAEDDYPRYTKLQNIAGPFIYICTKQEYDRLVLAKSDKKTFDRIILNITRDTDRAKKLIRNYFKRVELANQYFTSYKEGWKTDRGMIYVIFGLPDEVFKFNDREVWSYKNDLFKITFNFTKATSVFDPHNYVLIREKRFQETWYEVIDLWRNARF